MPNDLPTSATARPACRVVGVDHRHELELYAGLIADAVVPED